MKSLVFTSMLLASFVTFGCGPSGNEPEPPNGSGGSGGGPAACPMPTGTTIVHDAPVEVDETWRAADRHVVQGFVSVRKGATLTIEPCATIEVEKDGGISIANPGTPTTGTLIAEGDATHPIRFEGKDGARWGHILVDAGATARLAYVSLDGGGSIHTDGATVAVAGAGTLPSKKSLFVDHVTITSSKGAGLSMRRMSGFAPESKDLVISGSGGLPMVIEEHAIGTLPSGSYTGNAEDVIVIDPAFHLAEDATMKNLGVPYRVGTFPNGSLVVGGGPDAPLTTLTIEPGVRVGFFPGTMLAIENVTGAHPASGALVARGTAAEPVVFTSGAKTPQPGDWRGLWFGGIARAANSIKHARIEYTGADCGCVLVSCSAVAGYEGAVIFSQEPASAFIEDTTIAHGSGHGVVLGYSGAMVDFKPGIVFEEIAGCPQTLPSAPSCPNPKPACE